MTPTQAKELIEKMLNNLHERGNLRLESKKDVQERFYQKQQALTLALEALEQIQSLPTEMCQIVIAYWDKIKQELVDSTPERCQEVLYKPVAEKFIEVEKAKQIYFIKNALAKRMGEE